jgi:RNA polymerase sigma-70 factor (ECF subfamily)
VFVASGASVEEWSDGVVAQERVEVAFSGDRLERAMSSLNAAHREAFLLKYVEELSYDEIAELTGTGISALKMRVSRARNFLRVALTEAFDE